MQNLTARSVCFANKTEHEEKDGEMMAREKQEEEKGPERRAKEEGQRERSGYLQREEGYLVQPKHYG